MSMNAEFRLLRFARCLRVAHHVPGRIRLRLADRPEPLGLGTIDDAQRFATAIAAADGIGRISLNPLARSCTVEYDPAIIPPSAWEAVLSGQPAAGADILLQTLVGAVTA